MIELPQMGKNRAARRKTFLQDLSITLQQVLETTNSRSCYTIQCIHVLKTIGMEPRSSRISTRITKSKRSSGKKKIAIQTHGQLIQYNTIHDTKLYITNFRWFCHVYSYKFEKWTNGLLRLLVTQCRRREVMALKFFSAWLWERLFGVGVAWRLPPH